MSAPTWVPVTGTDLQQYLAALAARGKRQDRARAVSAVTAHASGSGRERDVLVEVEHTGLGPYRITLTGCTILAGLWVGSEAPDDEWGPALRLLEEGTWEVRELGTLHAPGSPDPLPATVKVEHRTAAGLSSVTLHCSSLELLVRHEDPVEPDAAPEEPLWLPEADVAPQGGACSFCGSTRFHLQAHASVPVELEDGDLRVSGPVTLRDVYVRLRCAECTTLHPSTSSDHLRGLTLEGGPLPRRLLR